MIPFQYYALFPTCVSVYNLERSFTKKELEIVDDLLKEDDMMPNVSNHMSKNTNVLNETIFANLKNEILDGFNHYVDEIISPLYDIEIYITQSWLNLTTKNGSHHLHKHSNSFLSGVLYINTTNDDEIVFKKPSESNLIFQMLKSDEKITLLNADFWRVPALTGQLIIFPSSLEHMVNQIQTDHRRISLSMNTFIKGKIGQETAVNLLELF
jgi:uncharacterized protein (TIGR02466 family)